MKISIIVPVGRPDTASATILSILGQSCCPDDLEILCVGAALTSISAQFDDSRIRYVHLEQRCNPAQTRMAGVAHATGNIYLFVDDDIELDSHVLEQLLRVVARHPNLGAVGARLPCTEKTYFSRVTDFANFWSQQSLRSGARRWLYSAVLAVPAKVFNKAGGFNPELAIGEDVDLTGKIYLDGYDVLYCADIIGYHNHRRTNLGTTLSYFWKNGGLAKLYFQSSLQLRCFKVWIVLRNIIQWLYNTISCNREAISGLIVYLPGVLLMYCVMSVSQEYHYQKFMKVYIEKKITSENLASYPIKDFFLLRAIQRRLAGEKLWSYFFLMICYFREFLYLSPIVIVCYFLGSLCV